MSLSATSIPLKSLSHNVPELGLMRTESSAGACWRHGGQIEHLERGSIKSDQVFYDEPISSLEGIVH